MLMRCYKLRGWLLKYGGEDDGEIHGVIHDFKDFLLHKFEIN